MVYIDQYNKKALQKNRLVIPIGPMHFKTLFYLSFSTSSMEMPGPLVISTVGRPIFLNSNAIAFSCSTLVFAKTAVLLASFNFA